LSRNSPKTPNASKAFPHLNKRSHGAAKTSLLKNLSRQPTGRSRSDRFGKPVRPVWETGKAGFAWTVGKNTARGSTLPKPNLDLPNRSTDLNKTLGILGTPHEESKAKFNPTKTRPKGGIKEIPPRALPTQELKKPQNRAPLLTNLGGESQPKEPRRVPTNFPHQIPKRKVPKTSKEITKRGLRKSPPRTTGENTSKL
jgi:hypothetical protein